MTKYYGREKMFERGYKRTLAACLAGVANQAVITNVTALLFVSFSGLYGFSLVRLGLLTAINFTAQMFADVLLTLLIGRVSSRILALAASAASCAGLVFYGAVPLLFSGGALYGGIAAATAVFAFAGGMLEVVLNGVADRLPPASSVSICLLHTAYAWAQAALALVLCGYIILFEGENWNFAMFALALVPLTAFALLLGADTGDGRAKGEAAPAPVLFGEKKRGSGRPRHAFYLSALAAIFFGYGAEVSMNQWMSTLFSETFSVSGEFFGVAASAVFLGLGGLFYVRLSRRRERFPFYALLLSALAAFGCFAAAAVCEGILSFAAAAVCGLFVGMLSPGVMTVSSENLPADGGRMLASLAVASDLGAAALPALAGALSGAVGLKSSFLILSAAPLLCACFLSSMRKNAGKPR